jgi:hypothetical protein
MPESREDSVYLAKLAEQAERYEGQYHCFVSCAQAYDAVIRDGREHEACCFI